MTDEAGAHRPTTHGRSDPGSLGREPLCSTSGAGRGWGRERRVIGSHPGHWGARGPARGARETPFKTPAPTKARVDGSGDGGEGRGDQVRAGTAGGAELGGAPGRGGRGRRTRDRHPSSGPAVPDPPGGPESLLGTGDLRRTNRLRRTERKEGQARETEAGRDRETRRVRRRE